MATPADMAAAEKLIELYRQANASLAGQLAEALADPAKARQAARLTKLITTNSAIVSDLRSASKSWITNQLPVIYANGAAASIVGGEAFAWSLPHVEAVQSLATRTWDDVAAKLANMDATGRRALREMARDAARGALLESKTAAQAGRSIEHWAAQQGVGAVTYANGAVHAVGDYADTLARTVTATAYNEGTFTQCRADGFEWVEVYDGPDCGWTGHHDSDKANGTVRRLEDAESNPISHPRCARSFAPAVDVVDQAGADAARRYDAETQAQMAADERARAASAPTTLSGRSRSGRSPRGERPPRSARAPRGAPTVAAPVIESYPGGLSAKQAQEWMMERYAVTADGAKRAVLFEGMKTDTANEFAATMHDLLTSYPATAEHVRIFGAGSPVTKALNVDGKRIRNMAPRSYADATTAGSIRLKNRTVAQFAEGLTRDVATGFHPPGVDNVAGMIRHEFGHHLKWQAERQSSRGEVSAAMDEVYRKHLGLGPEAGSAYWRARYNLINDHVSGYATSNDDELVAEAFAYVTSHPAPSSFAVDLIRVILRFAEGAP